MREADDLVHDDLAPDDLAYIVRQFAIDGSFLEARLYGSGHINRSYRASFDDRGHLHRYLVQRVNGEVFPDLDSLMENVQRVTSHLAMKLAGKDDVVRRVLTLVPARDGRAWHREVDGSLWRVFRFIEGAHSYDPVETPGQAFAAAKAFGAFQGLLADLPAPCLHETIPGFHDTPRRLLALERAVEADVANRAAGAGPEIARVLSLGPMSHVLLDAGLPWRVTHNDTKLNNVLFDDLTKEALCVVDLDTVMPGFALYDFGDMVRTATSPTQEDERDLSRVTMHFSLFEAIVRGYLSSAGGFLTPAEIQYLPVAGKLIAFEQAIRFLTDYLAGDRYYRVTRPGQNLDRCRTQLKLVASIEQQEEKMHTLVDKVSRQNL